MARKSRNNEEARKRRREYEASNCLQDILLELMEDRRIEPRHIHTATGISYATLSDWILGNKKCQKLDGRILSLAKFFNVSIHYLAFGIGDESPAFGEGDPSSLYKNGEKTAIRKKAS